MFCFGDFSDCILTLEFKKSTLLVSKTKQSTTNKTMVYLNLITAFHVNTIIQLIVNFLGLKCGR